MSKYEKLEQQIKNLQEKLEDFKTDLKYMKIHRKLKVLSNKSMKDFESLDKDLYKYDFCYDIISDKFAVSPGEHTYINSSIIFSSKEDCKNAIKEIGKEDLKFYFGIKE